MSDMHLKVFYDPDTGQVVGWVDGYVDNERAEGFVLQRGGRDMDSTLIPKEDSLSEKILAPESPVSGIDVKFDFESKAVRPLDDKELADRKAENEKAKKDAADWRKANPPRDLAAEVDQLKTELATLKTNKPVLPKP